MSDPRRRTAPAALLALALGLTGAGSAARAQETYLWDQGSMLIGGGQSISTIIPASMFTTSASVRLQVLELWVFDDLYIGVNGQLDAFDGTLGWAILADDFGSPGGLLALGETDAVAAEPSGNPLYDTDSFRLRIRLATTLVLPPGAYWLAIREGVWSAPLDSTQLFWRDAQNQLGAGTAYTTIPPTTWWVNPGDRAFVLSGVPAPWHQEALDLALPSVVPITGRVAAADFTLEGTTRLELAELQLQDSEIDDNGHLGAFDGSLGWAVLTDAGGEPGTVVAAGVDPDPELINLGAQIDDYDVLTARVRLEGLPELPGPATYWLLVREGAWSDPFDPSPIYWALTQTPLGAPVLASTSTGPSGPWTADPESRDVAFVLLAADPVFASGFEGGGLCPWSGSIPTINCF